MAPGEMRRFFESGRALAFYNFPYICEGTALDPSLPAWGRDVPPILPFSLQDPPTPRGFGKNGRQNHTTGSNRTRSCFSSEPMAQGPNEAPGRGLFLGTPSGRSSIRIFPRALGRAWLPITNGQKLGSDR